jgi:hypothetical protein
VIKKAFLEKIKGNEDPETARASEDSWKASEAGCKGVVVGKGEEEEGREKNWLPGRMAFMTAWNRAAWPWPLETRLQGSATVWLGSTATNQHIRITQLLCGA